MRSAELGNLCKVGQLKAEPYSQTEFEAHLRSGRERLANRHDVRKGFEYEAVEEVTDDLCEQVIRCAGQLAAMLTR